jgi:RNA-binding motif X-linked protein 2
VNLVRDKKTGKPKGFCFLAYEDQRSTILAVDNFNGISLCGRTIRVDHVKDYKPPNFHQGKGDFQEDSLYKPSGPDGRGWGRFREYTEEEKKILKAFDEEERQMEKEENQGTDILQNLKKRATEVLKDEDEIWEKRLMSQVDRDIYEDNKEIQDARKLIEEEREKARQIKEELKIEKRREKMAKKLKSNDS